MTEIDFEELDRAVNSVMLPSEDDNAEDDKKSEVVEESAADTVAVNKKVTDEEIQDKKPVFTPRQLTKSSGRFMDVVHPSSDMRQKTTSKNDIKEEKPATQDEPVIDEKPKHLDMPDPLDVEEKPTDSPFLADAKVEKRPLGAFSEVQAQPFEMKESDKAKYSDLLSGKKTDVDTKDESAQSEEEKPALIVEEAKESEKTETPVVDETPYEAKVEGRNTHLPLELQKDILSVESDPTTSKANIESSKSAKSPVAIGDAYIHDSATELTQQYKEKPSSADQSNGSIYDTKEYHAALLHPAKKKSGWMTIVWIILIAAVVIGASVAAYFLYFA